MSTFSPSGQQFIAVHIGPPPGRMTGLVERMLGHQSWVGALLAGHILQGALERAGILVTGGSFFGELADCVMLAEVTDVAAAVEIIQRELDTCFLPGLYQIGVREASHWRSIYPNSVARVDWLFDSDRQAAAFEDFKKFGRDFLAQGEALCRQLRAQVANASGPEKQLLDAAVTQLERKLHQNSDAIAPELPDEEGNPS